MFSKTHNRRIWKTALLPIIDYLALLLGAGLVYLIRYRWFEDSFLGLNFGIKQVTGQDYLLGSLSLALGVVLVYAFFGLYEVGTRVGFWSTLFKLSFGVFVVLLSLITYFFFNEYDRSSLPSGVPVSRFILATGGFIALYFVFFGRIVLWVVEQFFYRLGFGKMNVVLIGDSSNYLFPYFEKRQDINKIYQYPELNQKTYNFLEVLIKKRELAEIYLFSQQNELESKLATLAERYKVGFIFSPSGFTQYEVFDLKPVNIEGKIFLELKHSNLDGWQVILKRFFDFVFAFGFLTIFSWFYLIIALAIKLDSEGSVFYGSERVGPDGKVFKLWKFRRLKQAFCTTEKDIKTLKIEEELIQKLNMKPDSVLYKIKDDPRVTRVGKFLEKYSIDELPQFFNVLIGNMSLVGPRPHQPREVSKYSNHHFKVLNIKPGITGLAQINGRSDLSFEDEVRLDTFYVEHWNFYLDIRIILKTPLVVIFKRHGG